MQLVGFHSQRDKGEIFRKREVRLSTRPRPRTHRPWHDAHPRITPAPPRAHALTSQFRTAARGFDLGGIEYRTKDGAGGTDGGRETPRSLGLGAEIPQPLQELPHAYPILLKR